MPTSSKSVEKEEVIIQKCVPSSIKTDTVDNGDRNSTTTSSSSATTTTISQKKPRRSLTSFSIFRKDKKFSSESKIIDATKSAAVAVVKDLAPQSTRTNNLVLDNTRLEVGVDVVVDGWMSWMEVVQRCE